jgi:putative ABC transport system permease protein
MTAVYIFGVVAIFILLLACINFINLSTARSVERAKEVGIRKTFGSDKKSLIGQFLIESVFISVISMLIAFGIIILLIPAFNTISGKDLSVTYFLQAKWILVLITFVLITGLIAGLYPAFVLSSFNPIMVLKGRFKSNRYGLALRNGLVIFQFAISVILIISTIVVNRQMNYMLGNKLGFKKDHVIVLERTIWWKINCQLSKMNYWLFQGLNRQAVHLQCPVIRIFLELHGRRLVPKLQ